MPYCFHDEVEKLQVLLATNTKEGANAHSAVSALLDQARTLQLEALALLSNAFMSYEKRTCEDEQQDFEYIALQQLDLLENFQAIKEHDQEEDERQAAIDVCEALRVSELPPSGFTMTQTELHNAAKQIVFKAREIFGRRPAPLEARVWAYRIDGCSMLCCDLHQMGDVTKNMPITVTASGLLELSHPDEPQVYDMPEALHLVGLITRALGANVVIGRGANEVNSAVLQKPLKDGETNGPVELWSVG